MFDARLVPPWPCACTYMSNEDVADYWLDALEFLMEVAHKSEPDSFDILREYWDRFANADQGVHDILYHDNIWDHAMYALGLVSRQEHDDFYDQHATDFDAWRTKYFAR